MSSLPPSITELRLQYRSGALHPREVLQAALSRANSNAGANVFLARDPAWTEREAQRLRPEALEEQPLWGVPIALKDCFDLQGFLTTSGSKALAAEREPATEDSAVAARLRAAGAVLTGKTHLHQLAYGITGENPDFGDSTQPGAPVLLTGGSSSGSAASVLEGSAMAAIGTDTGGSVRVPAALCGLLGFRSSITLGTDELWTGGEHLAPTFDTLGWLYRDPADGPLLGSALFGLPRAEAPDVNKLRFGVPHEPFLEDCDPEVITALNAWADHLALLGATVERFDAGLWANAMQLFAPIQASEAAALHPEPRDIFD
ncbi:MAG TPA: amidase, partial [Acidobacteriaceae bacterium]|nr:amidase [Acidobacteriaceae bacterium]